MASSLYRHGTHTGPDEAPGFGGFGINIEETNIYTTKFGSGSNKKKKTLCQSYKRMTMQQKIYHNIEGSIPSALLRTWYPK